MKDAHVGISEISGAWDYALKVRPRAASSDRPDWEKTLELMYVASGVCVGVGITLLGMSDDLDWALKDMSRATSSTRVKNWNVAGYDRPWTPNP